jgi:predicted DNA-binding transcriptional regulator AlpA
MTADKPNNPLNVPHKNFKKRSERRGPNDAHTIPSFCKSNAISESLFYSLKRQGKGPREIDLGGRILITREAEADWRLEREAETARDKTKANAKRKAAFRPQTSANVTA